MFPYQIYQALADQRIHDMLTDAHRHNLAAEARRRQRLAAARLAPMGQIEHPSRDRNVVARLLALVRISTRAADSGPRTSSTRTSESTAGPMGCVA